MKYYINSYVRDRIANIGQDLVNGGIYKRNGSGRKFLQQATCIRKLCVAYVEDQPIGWSFVTHGGTLMVFVKSMYRGCGIGTSLVSKATVDATCDLYYARDEVPKFFLSLPKHLQSRYSGSPTIQALKETYFPTPKEIAQKVRFNVEQVAEDLDSDPHLLDGLCAIASMALMRSFHSWEYYDAETVLGFYTGKTHCWTPLCGRIYDVTATQFGTTVKVVDCLDTNSRYEKHKIITSSRNMPRSWPQSQKPLKPIVDRLVFKP